MKNIFKKTLLIALVAALAVASLPLVSASAAGLDDPKPPQGQASNERLEKVWARQLRLYEKIGNGFERDEEFTDRVQKLIDRAKENGKDISAVQAALDAFEAALKGAHPVYESGKGTINSHQGFDENGKVTDPEKAKETLQAMGEKLKEIKDAMGGTGKALREAIKAFREANPRPENLPAPEGD
jgi:DNA-binding transcriptional MerR regulator